jgi:cell division protein FtsB
MNGSGGIRGVLRVVRPRNVVFAAVLVYFAVNAFDGQQGLIAWRDHAMRAQALQTELDGLSDRKAELETRLKLVRGGAIDRDLLEETAARDLMLAKPGTYVVALPDATSSR